MKGAETMATVAMKSAMNPKHPDDFAGCIDPLPRTRLVSAPVFFAGLEQPRGSLPGF
jgi:hypothetical protein